MDDEVTLLRACYPNFEQLSGLVTAYQQCELIELEDTDRIAVCVQDLVIGQSMPPCGREDLGTHSINLC